MPPKSQKLSTDESIEVVIGRLLEITEATAKSLESLNEESRLTGAMVTSLQTTFDHMKAVVHELDKVVRTGNGHSVVTRIEILNRELDQIQKTLFKIDERFKSIDGFRANVAKVQTESKVLSRTFWIITGFVGWTITTALALVSILVGR